jgi:hypothetical protein
VTTALVEPARLNFTLDELATLLAPHRFNCTPADRTRLCVPRRAQDRRIDAWIVLSVLDLHWLVTMGSGTAILRAGRASSPRHD